MSPALFLRRGFAVVAPFALLVAACGDDDDSAAEATEDAVNVSFTAPEDDDTFAGAVPFTMAADGLTIEPAGEVHADAGHFHVIADDGCVDVGEPVAKDADHLHFGKGQTEGKIYLEPGTHELCLQPGDGVHTALAPTDTVSVEVGIASRDELCAVIGVVDVLFEEADTGGAEFADRKVMYENIRRLFVQLDDGLDQVDADVRDSVAQAFTFGSDIATAFAEAADEASAVAAIEAIYGTVGVQSGADSPWAGGSAWVLEECGVDIDGEG
jgi:hypothetical protein